MFLMLINIISYILISSLYSLFSSLIAILYKSKAFSLSVLKLRGKTLIPFWQKSKPFDFDRFRWVSMGFDGFRWQVSTGFDGFRWGSISMPVETSGFCPATLV